MRKVREILRQKLSLGLTHREVAMYLAVSVGIVTKVVTRARAAGIDWPVAHTLDEEALEVRLYGPRLSSTVPRPKPDPAWIHVERKRPGVTLELLHLEYLEQHPDGYRYTQFCQHYRDWLKTRKLSMRQVHVAGEKLFVDYSGKRASNVCPRTGEVTEVELFVAVLGASNYTYAEATRTQQCVDFIQSHVRAFEYLGRVSAVILPDQLKSGATTSCIYDPKVQRTYEEMARHYGTAVFPARPRKPKDKAKVEVGPTAAPKTGTASGRAPHSAGGPDVVGHRGRHGPYPGARSAALAAASTPTALAAAGGGLAAAWRCRVGPLGPPCSRGSVEVVRKAPGFTPRGARSGARRG